MKPFLFLLSALVLMILAWVFARVDSPKSKVPPASLNLPTQASSPEEVAKFAEQLLSFHPDPTNILEGVRLLEAICRSVPESGWGRVHNQVFYGWACIHQTPGAQPAINAISPILIERFGIFANRVQLEQMVRWCNRNSLWSPDLERALARTASHPLVSYRGSRLEDVVEASIAAGDIQRGKRYLEAARWQDGVASDAKVPTLAISKAVDLHAQAKTGQGRLSSLLFEWRTHPPETRARDVLVEAAAELLKAKRGSDDFSDAAEVLSAAGSRQSDREFWTSVLDLMTTGQNLVSAYQDENALSFLSAKIREVFGPAEFESDFWTQLADRTPSKHIGARLWRIDCLTRASIAAVEESKQATLAKAAFKECSETGDVEKAKVLVDALVKANNSDSSKSWLIELLKDLKDFESREQLRLAALAANEPLERAKAEVRLTQRRLERAKAAKASADIIQNLEKEVREAEVRVAQMGK